MFFKHSFQNWQAIISSSLASLLLLGVSTLIAIALVVHSELVPKKMMHISTKTMTKTTTKSPTTNATAPNTSNPKTGKASTLAQDPKESQKEKHQQHQLLSSSLMDNNSTSCLSITQISTGTLSAAPSGNLRPSTTGNNCNNSNNNLVVQLPSGIRGAIGISWLLPLLFATASPLISSITGKWSQHWWLEIMSSPLETEENQVTSVASSGVDYFQTQTSSTVFSPLGDNGSNKSTQYFTSTTITTATSTSSDSSHVTFPFDTWTASQNPLSSLGLGHLSSAYDFTDSNFSSEESLVMPSLSFLIFVCVDLLFILLFLALFSILMKKLLWLWRKNRSNRSTHPLNKINMAMTTKWVFYDIIRWSSKIGKYLLYLDAIYKILKKATFVFNYNFL